MLNLITEACVEKYTRDGGAWVNQSVKNTNHLGKLCLKGREKATCLSSLFQYLRTHDGSGMRLCTLACLDAGRVILLDSLYLREQETPIPAEKNLRGAFAS